MPSNRTTLHCFYCGSSFPAKGYKADTAKYCSRYCMGQDRLGKRVGTGRYVSRGYIYVLREGHPGANVRGFVAEHRLVAEQTLGRYLTANEVVHHINSDQGDNRPENLQVMTQAEHARLHFVGNQHGRIEEWAKEYNSCVQCGTTDRPHCARGMCRKCYRHQFFVTTGT